MPRLRIGPLLRLQLQRLLHHSRFLIKQLIPRLCSRATFLTLLKWGIDRNARHSQVSQDALLGSVGGRERRQFVLDELDF